MSKPEEPEYEPQFDEQFAKDLVGKRVLVGMTYRDPKQEAERLEQFCGPVLRANRQEGIVLFVEGEGEGEERSVPPDTGLLQAAPEGEYRLRTTGAIVVNPDYLVTYIVYPRDAPTEQ